MSLMGILLMEAVSHQVSFKMLCLPLRAKLDKTAFTGLTRGCCCPFKVI